MKDKNIFVVLADLISQRDSLNERIDIITACIKKAAYDACTKEQLITINENRLKEGRRQITRDEFHSGILCNDDEEESGF